MPGKLSCKENAGHSRGVDVRHLVDVYQQILNCALPVVFSELWFLSIPESSRHVRLDDQLIHPKDLAVDLVLSRASSVSTL
jgi:hypothetical protein